MHWVCALRLERIWKLHGEALRFARLSCIEHVVEELTGIARGEFVTTLVLRILREDQPELSPVARISIAIKSAPRCIRHQTSPRNRDRLRAGTAATGGVVTVTLRVNEPKAVPALTETAAELSALANDALDVLEPIDQL